MADEIHHEHNLIRQFVFRFVKKYIAGSTLSAVLEQARENQSRGMRTTITFLNDAVGDPTKARYNANAYVQLARQASRLHLNADISVRLGQLGYSLNDGILDKCFSDVVNAVPGTTKLWLEFENGTNPEEFFGFYRQHRKTHKNIGLEIPVWYPLEVGVIKKNLRANDSVKLTAYSYSDTGLASDENGRVIEAKKGGKEEMPNKKRMFENYVSHIGKLLQADVSVTVLDPDAKLISKIASFSKEYKKNLIFELPLGYNKKLMGKLAKAKVNLSVYAPYGKDWTSYVVNKLTVGHGHIKGVMAKVLKEKGEDGAK